MRCGGGVRAVVNEFASDCSRGGHAHQNCSGFRETPRSWRTRLEVWRHCCGLVAYIGPKVRGMARSSTSSALLGRARAGRADTRWLQVLAAIVATFFGVRCGSPAVDSDELGDSLRASDGTEESVSAAEGDGDEVGDSVDEGADVGETDPVAQPANQSLAPVDPPGDESRAPAAPSRALAEVVCDDFGFPSFVRGLRPSDAVDYLAWVRWEGEGSVPEVLQRSGEACADGTQQRTCVDVAAPPPGEAFDKSVDYVAYEYLVYRRGAEVGYVLDSFELLEFVGEVDTPNEAALVFWGVNRPVSCDALYEQADGSYWSEGDYLVETCPATVQHIELTVSVEGRVEPTVVGEPMVSDTCFY